MKDTTACGEVTSLLLPLYVYHSSCTTTNRCVFTYFAGRDVISGDIRAMLGKVSCCLGRTSQGTNQIEIWLVYL